jgi:protein SCO1/2
MIAAESACSCTAMAAVPAIRPPVRGPVRSCPVRTRALRWSVRPLLTAVLLAAAASGSLPAADDPAPAAGAPAAGGAGFSPHVGTALPLDLVVRDAAGRPLALRSLCDGRRPLLLIPAYYTCPMLCGLVLNGALAAMQGMPWTPGDQYRVATISFDAADTPTTARRKQQAVLDAVAHDDRFRADRWPFCSADQVTIDRLLAAIGERVQTDAAGDDGLGRRIAHPAVLVVVSGTGTIASYLPGLGVRPTDLRLALIDASQGRTASWGDQVLAWCYHYDPATHRYGPFVARFLRIGAVTVLLVIGLGMACVIPRLRRRAAAAADPGSTAAGRR